MKKAVLVTGVSGVGKSTLSGVLKKMGYTAHDMDDTPGLCTMVYKGTKTPVDESHSNADVEKVKDTEWLCSKDNLAALIVREPGLAFFCGAVSNIDDIIPLFDRIVLLKVDGKIMRNRLTSRTTNDFGRTSDVQDWILEWKDWFEDKMIEKGAVEVDASQDLERVAKDVVAAAT